MRQATIQTSDAPANWSTVYSYFTWFFCHSYCVGYVLISQEYNIMCIEIESVKTTSM